MREDYKTRFVEYFKKNLKKGYTSESLKWALLSQGYSRTLVEYALEKANKELSEEAPVLNEKPVIKYEILDENNKPIYTQGKKPWWKRIFG